MRVLQLISSTGFYGAEKMILELSRGLSRAGHDVMVANLASNARDGGKLLERTRALGIASREITCRGRLDLAAVLNIRKLVENNGIEIVHSHGYKSNFYACVARRASRAKLVATCHNWLGESAKMRYYRWLDKIVIKTFDRVAVVSRTLREEVSGSGIAPDRLAVIPNGIDAALPRTGTAETLRKTLRLPPDARIIGTLGRLSPEKGYQVLLEALPRVFDAFPQAVCVIAGDGPQRAELEADAREREIAGRVFFAGSRDDAEDMLGMYEVFVQPSLTEGLPMALLEAMAAGRPVIATRVGEVPSVVSPGTGILIEPGSAAAVREALTALLEDADGARRMGRRAAERIRNNYSSHQMTNEYVGLYRELLG